MYTHTHIVTDTHNQSCTHTDIRDGACPVNMQTPHSQAQCLDPPCVRGSPARVRLAPVLSLWAWCRALAAAGHPRRGPGRGWGLAPGPPAPLPLEFINKKQNQQTNKASAAEVSSPPGTGSQLRAHIAAACPHPGKSGCDSSPTPCRMGKGGRGEGTEGDIWGLHARDKARQGLESLPLLSHVFLL